MAPRYLRQSFVMAVFLQIVTVHPGTAQISWSGNQAGSASAKSGYDKDLCSKLRAKANKGEKLDETERAQLSNCARAEEGGGGTPPYQGHIRID
jgi:hypothetical protein